jgi:hypothetical protein
MNNDSHENIIMSIRKKYKCCFCKFITKEHKLLIKHIDLAHKFKKPERKYNCLCFEL